MGSYETNHEYFHFSFIEEVAEFVGQNPGGLRGVMMKPDGDGDRKFVVSNIRQITWSKAEVRVKNLSHESYILITRL